MTVFKGLLLMGCFGLPLSSATMAQTQQNFGQDRSTPVQSFQFMQDNDLDKEDTGFISNVTEDTFNNIINAAMEIYSPMAEKNNETLQINNNWDDSTVNANCLRSYGSVTINMYGGLARRSEVTPDGFALVLCHELGHAYGGKPYVSPSNQMAAEGQADYYGAQNCLQKVLPKIAASELSVSTDEYIDVRCKKTANYAICVRQLQAGQSLGKLLSSLQKERTPDYQTPDATVVSKTILSYPKTVQCRLDTYHNGTLNLPRPACWYRD